MLLAACGSPPLAPSTKKLSVSHKEVVFPRTFVTYPTVEEVRVVNGGRAEDSFTVFELEGPFLVRPEGEVKVRGSSTATLRIQFSPPAAGTYEGVLRLQLGEKMVELPLRGVAEMPLTCPSTPCAEARFDPHKGECVVKKRPNGARCQSSNQCLEDTICQDGLCVGSDKVCKPPSACFRSVCNPEIGCEHIPDEPCEQPENPCRVARCDATFGCVEEDREDYTPCGPLTCQEQNVCLSGSCVKITEVPDGARCLHACGDGGYCDEGECKRPDGNRLEGSWWLDVEAEAFAAVDAAGNLYWLECEDANCRLASVSANGYERFRTAAVSMPEGPGGLLIRSEGAVFWSRERLVATQGMGEIKWQRRVADYLEGGSEPEEPAPTPSLLQLIDAGDDRLVARVHRDGVDSLLGISGSDGRLDWVGGAPVSTIAADGVGRIYSVDQAEEGLELRAYDGSGDELWSVEVPKGTEILAVLPNRIFLASAGKLDVRLAFSGEPVWERPFAPKDLVLSSSHAFVIEEGPQGSRLVVLGVEAGEEKEGVFDLEGMEATSRLALRAEDRALLLAKYGEPAPVWWLEEFEAQGARAKSCAIPEVEVSHPWVFLPPANGEEARLVVRSEEGEIRTFVAPRLAPPPYGWSAEEGSFRRGGRPTQ